MEDRFDPYYISRKRRIGYTDGKLWNIREKSQDDSLVGIWPQQRVRAVIY